MKATDFLMSSYSGSISCSIRRIVFLCHGALSITKAYFFTFGYRMRCKEGADRINGRLVVEFFRFCGKQYSAFRNNKPTV